MAPGIPDEPIQATPPVLFEHFKKLYWSTLQDEARNMIEFHRELMGLRHDLSHGDRLDSSYLDSFRKIFNIWLGGQADVTDPPELNSIFDETIRRAQENLQEPSNDRSYHVSRLILQSHVEEVEVNSFGDHVRRVVRGILCGGCGNLIRSAVFYECEHGCEAGSWYEFVKGEPRWFQDEKLADEPPPTEGMQTQNTPADHHNPPYRLCTIYSRRQRMRLSRLEMAQTRIKKAHANEGKAQPKQRWHERFVENTVRATEDSGSELLSSARPVGLMVKSHFAPAGNFHLALMFGPLVFESGVKGSNHGVRVSPRPPPTLFAGKAVETQSEWPRQRLPILFKDRCSGQPKLGYTIDEVDQTPRPILACVKRVYGAAFSGYPESNAASQQEVIRCLAREGVGYAKIPRSKSAAARRMALDKAAQRLVQQMEKCIGREVDKHLERFGRRLVDLRDNVDWNFMMNNCQLLVNRLLQGDKDFEYSIPLFPSSLMSSSNRDDERSEDDHYRWPRYLVSFGNHIEGFGRSLYQPNCLITSYCQSMPMVEYDVLEYISWRSQQQQSEPNTHTRALGALSRLRQGGDDDTLPVNHLWLMPGDTLSLLQFHLVRQAQKYHGQAGGAWIDNRLRVLQLLDIYGAFAGALGVSLFNLLQTNRELLGQVTIPHARVLGNMRADESVRVTRMLGSRRAVVYDITGRVPSAMAHAVVHRNRRREERKKGEPVHGEEVLSRIVAWFVTPLSLVSPSAAAGLGALFRLHHGYWITLNVMGHTYVRQWLFKKAENMRDF
ncbi:uncharacterized protein B0H64DRAFT_445138 [Chaetomium fimeti]|uniref:Uncharacterized protein n=1 Tax=Chaetomium fimeti TaxID=1854472 RepID=A0AAE0H911_9PEZI|nr:hypothetical protein B0H64DRAFT_445138 [Chaetomium fimeti]